ncbi:MAG: hypothetical protein GF317_17435 [Candidatus Lokiarchaeota archaeon]|nr:hypothetical protein [Candidatus Lokiarchaeota archaeon]MBD3201302.1 hypothetical protein [Candidatus Lokiarchaeota archaeon]
MGKSLKYRRELHDAGVDAVYLQFCFFNKNMIFRYIPVKFMRGLEKLNSTIKKTEKELKKANDENKSLNEEMDRFLIVFFSKNNKFITMNYYY